MFVATVEDKDTGNVIRSEAATAEEAVDTLKPLVSDDGVFKCKSCGSSRVTMSLETVKCRTCNHSETNETP